MLRILLVEDDRFLGPALMAMLSLRARVRLARECVAAIRHLEQETFDVVLTDVDLGPGRDGLSLLEEVAERWPLTRRIAMSGEGRETRETFIMKPIERDGLALVLEGAEPSARPADETSISGFYVRPAACDVQDEPRVAGSARH